MTEKININELFENAMKDPSLFSTMDIDKLLEILPDWGKGNSTTEEVDKQYKISLEIE